MKKAFYFLHFVLLVSFLSAQRNTRTEFRFGVHAGVNQLCIGVAPNTQMAGFSNAFSLSLILKSNRSPFRFHPTISFINNLYQAKIAENLTLNFPQANWCLSLQTGLAITKRLLFRGGFFIQYSLQLNKYRMTITDNTEGYLSSGFDELWEKYEPSVFQVGAQLGFSIALGKKGRVGFDIQAQQYATGISDNDYYMIQSVNNAEPKLLINRNSKPLVLMIGLNFKLMTKKQREAEDEADEAGENMRF